MILAAKLNGGGEASWPGADDDGVWVRHIGLYDYKARLLLCGVGVGGGLIWAVARIRPLQNFHNNLG
jgi:hypothetical protein